MITLHDDAITVYRSSASSDVEGNDIGAVTTVLTGYGFLGTPSGADLTVASRTGQAVNNVLAVELDSPNDIRVGDEVTVRSQRFRVGHIIDVRSHYRVFLERVA